MHFTVLTLTLALLVISCSQMAKHPDTPATQDFQIFKLANPPIIGESPQKQKILTGGFSGLIFDGKSENGNYKYITVTDRGPNTDPKEFKGIEKRPFLIPKFQPEIIFLETVAGDLNQSGPKEDQLRITKRIPITNPKGEPIHGLPNTAKDEHPSDPKGNDLARELQGLDIEGITRDDQGNFWVCEEYRPSILKISQDGKILKRYIPKNSFTSEELKKLKAHWGEETVQDSLPEIFSNRQANRGFEGLTYHQGKIIAALQSPTKFGELDIPWLVFDPKSETSKTTTYKLDHALVDKIGDLASDQKRVYAIEQNSELGARAIKKIYAVTGFEDSQVKKDLLIELNTLPEFSTRYDHEKLEGLTVVNNQMLAVIHDNDFGLSGALNKKEGYAQMSTDISINLLQIKVKLEK